MPTDLSINLQLVDRLCLVVGAGRVGDRKAGLLLAAGASVRLVDPRGGSRTAGNHLEIVRREFRTEDLEGAFLAVAATDRSQVNQQIAREARARGILTNVADGSAESDVSFPAVRQQGSLRLAISTRGLSPAFAGLAADHLLEILGPEWDLALELAGRLRAWQLTHPEHTAYNRSILRQLIEQGVIGQLAAGRFDLVDQWLHETCGAGCTLAALDLKLPRDYDR